MPADAAIARYAHALGRYQAAWRFAALELRHAVQVASVSVTWDTYCRDAGPGAIGPAHEEAADRVGVTTTSDGRRDALLLWLIDNGSPTIREGAGTLAQMTNAGHRFSVGEHALLDAARDAVCRFAFVPGPIAKCIGAEGWSDNITLRPLVALATAVDALRRDADFLEAAGTKTRLALPKGTIAHYVPAEPGATWALNLALLAQRSLITDAPPPAGLVSRALFRNDLDADQLASTLIDGAAQALETGYALFDVLEPELARGRQALTHHSKNARTRDAWRLVVALRSLTRTQLRRALGLSRAGADIQARTLSEAGLVTLGAGGGVRWQHRHRSEAQSQPLEDGPLTKTTAALDDAMAEIDKLLAQTSAEKTERTDP